MKARIVTSFGMQPERWLKLKQIVIDRSTREQKPVTMSQIIIEALEKAYPECPERK